VAVDSNCQWPWQTPDRSPTRSPTVTVRLGACPVSTRSNLKRGLNVVKHGGTLDLQRVSIKFKLVLQQGCITQAVCAQTGLVDREVRLLTRGPTTIVEVVNPGL
jgi:hypothetical protein